MKCGLKIIYIFFFCLSLPELYCQDAPQAGEQEAWYLISETELRDIERYKEKSEAERRNWLLQVQELKRDSVNSNALLAQAREQNRKLEQSFNEYEAGQLTLVSSKNGEIEGLKQQLADKALETEKWKGKATARLIIIIAAIAVVVLLLAIKIYLWIKGGAAASLIKYFLGR